MKERIFKNWKTTLTGILMLGAGLALVGIGKATLTEYVVFRSEEHTSELQSRIRI